jgi:hypothetical protein
MIHPQLHDLACKQNPRRRRKHWGTHSRLLWQRLQPSARGLDKVTSSRAAQNLAVVARQGRPHEDAVGQWLVALQIRGQLRQGESDSTREPVLWRRHREIRA